MADFEIKECGEGWILIPACRASRAWCRSNLPEEVPKSGEGYVVGEQLMLLIIERYMNKKPGQFGF